MTITTTTEEYCDRHGGFVPAGQTKAYERRSPYRICDGCVEAARMRDCPRCPYALGAHRRDGSCPETEAEAVQIWGAS